jgi:hypothetical protein
MALPGQVRCHPLLLASVSVAFLFLLAGCRGTPVPQPAAQTHIQQLAGLYIYYATKHNDLGPASVDELRTWSNALPAAEKAKFGDLDNLFTSPRDHLPYKIVPKVSLKAQLVTGKTPIGAGQARPSMVTPKVIVYESTSGDGKRWVALSVGRAAKLVTEEEFNQLLAKATKS